MPARAGRWLILERLGQGGMGVVHRARHDDGRVAALKLVDSVRPAALAAFDVEIAVLSRLSHPDVVRILDHGVDDDRPWYAMDLVVGRTMREVLGAAGPTSADSGRTVLFDDDEPLDAPVPAEGPGDLSQLGLVRALCAPLAYLHGEGVVHADLKPENVIVRDDGSVAILDFGLASTASAREVFEPARRAAGTLGYISPERLRGEPLDARADLYALGCMLHEVVVGRPPFVGEGGSITAAHLTMAPRPLSERIPDVPRALEDLVQALLAKDPRDRPARAEDVGAILAELGATAPEGRPAPRPWLYRPSFEGRLAERDAVVDATYALVTGPPGVGRTRLLSEAARRLAGAGVRVHGVRCVPGALPPPFLARALRDAGRADGAREPVWRAAAAWLVAGGDAALAIDDLQFGDELLLAFVHWLVEVRPPGLRLVATALLERAEEALLRLAASPRVSHVALGPLAADAAAEVARAMLGLAPGAASPVAEAAAAAGGVPSDLAERMRLAADQGTLRRDAGAWQVDDGAFDRRPEEVTRLRVARLQHAGTLALAALAGGFERATLRGLGADDDAIDAALAEGIRAGLVDEQPLGFASERVRAVLLDALEPEARRAAERRLVEGLLAAPDPDPARLAALGQRTGDPRTRDWFLAATVAAERRSAVHEALAAFREATRDRVGPVDEAHEAAHRALLRLGRLDEALALTERLVAADPSPAARRLHAHSLWRLSRAEEARTELLELLPGTSGVLRGRVLALLGGLAVELGDGTAARAWNTEAATLLAGEPRLLPPVAMNLALVEHIEERLEAAVAAYHRAIAASRAAGDRRLEASSLGNLGAALADLGRLDEAERVFREALSLDRLLGNARAESLVLGRLGSVLADRDARDEALAAFEQAIALEQGGTRFAAIPQLCRARARRRWGDLPDPAELAELADVFAGDRPHRIEVLAEQGHLAVARGEDPTPFLVAARAAAEGLVSGAHAPVRRLERAIAAGPAAVFGDAPEDRPRAPG